MARSTTHRGSENTRSESRVSTGAGIGGESYNSIARVEDLPADFFAVGRMHGSESFMLIDSKEKLKKQMG